MSSSNSKFDKDDKMSVQLSKETTYVQDKDKDKDNQTPVQPSTKTTARQYNKRRTGRPPSRPDESQQQFRRSRAPSPAGLEERLENSTLEEKKPPRGMLSRE